jgi:cyclophilin family peptidyl-prolyl cis-trans isomerase
MQSIHILSKYVLIERFGSGPHYVELQLAFDPQSELYQQNHPHPHHHQHQQDDNKIMLQLAMPDEMPHTVFWFLEQVSRRLYDGTSIHRSATHVLQGGPHTNFLTPAELLGDDENTLNPLQARFMRSGFDQVPLPGEYYVNWTHQKYTIGYTNGGPDFYFNMLDNAHIHGPRNNYEEVAAAAVVAEPCFAKVIAGFDLVDAIHASPIQPGPYHALQHNVAIVPMRLLKPNEIIL